MRTHIANAGVKVESRYTADGIDITVQQNRPILVIQCNFSIETALFVFSVQCDILIVIITIVDGSD